MKIKFPEHKAGLTLNHNQHKNVYETVEEYINKNSQYYDDESWATPTSKKRAIETDELWELHWYPNTPIGFNTAFGAALEEVLNYVNNSTDSLKADE